MWVINWQKLLFVSLLLLLFILFSGAGLLWSGQANPPHAPNLEYSLIITPQTTQYPLPPDKFTIDLYATLPSEAGLTTPWGLWLEDDSGQWLIVAINGAQYITVRLCPANFTGQLIDCDPLQSTSTITYWHLFHHIKPPGEENFLRVNLIKNNNKYNEPTLEVWLNDEWVYAVPYAPSLTKQFWGYWEIPHSGVQWNFAQSYVWINEPTN